MLWAGGVFWLNPSFVWWLLPVAGALIVSIPVSVYSSRVSLGRTLRKAGLFVIPEELNPFDHGFQGDGFREIVVLIAVRAG